MNWSSALPNHSDQQRGESTSSKLWDLNMRIHGSQKLPTSNVANAKWRAGISKRVSINLNEKHALKIVSRLQAHMNMTEASSNQKNKCDKTHCTGSVDKFMRLIY